MRARSSLTEDQRVAAVALFEEGLCAASTAVKVEGGAHAVKLLYDRWRVRGRNALVEKPDRKHYSFEFKFTVVQRVLAGDNRIELAREYALSSARIIDPWVRSYRRYGEEGLRPKRAGRRPVPPNSDPGESSELDRLRDENERLRTQVAYLGKLRALREQGRQ